MDQYNSPSPSFLRTFEKYDLHIIIYDGLYSLNRILRTTLVNLKDFIEKTYEKYLKVANLALHIEELLYSPMLRHLPSVLEVR